MLGGVIGSVQLSARVDVLMGSLTMLELAML